MTRARAGRSTGCRPPSSWRDKSDVRRSRVREPNTDAYRDNIHNRVNYAVIDSQLVIEEERDEVRLELRIDTVICPIIEYFEIFLTRMQMCNRAWRVSGDQPFPGHQ